MGNCCGKPRKSEGGRTLNSAPAAAPPASNTGRSAAAPKFAGTGRTLGSAPAPSAESESVPVRANVAAAQAAQERLVSPAPKIKGKLQKDLDAQKSKTTNQTLTQLAKDNMATRTADANAKARNWD